MCLGVRTPRPRRRRFRSTSQPDQSKSVSFDIDSPNYRHGYESDDSDSTVGSIGASRRHRSYSRRRSSPPSTRQNVGRSTHETSRSSPDKKQESDSDSTIDLPDRFDSQGRLLPQREDDRSDPLEGLLRGLDRAFA